MNTRLQKMMQSGAALALLGVFGIQAVSWNPVPGERFWEYFRRTESQAFLETWTAISQSTTTICSKIDMLQTRIDGEFAQTWTSITQSTNTTATNIGNLQDRIDSEFAQTWTAITQSSNGTAAQIGNLQNRIDDEFAQTWTMVQNVDNQVAMISTGLGIPIKATGINGVGGIAPATISAPGRYYIAEDIPTAKITINADHVYLDLQERTVACVKVNAGKSHIGIANGAIDALGTGAQGLFVAGTVANVNYDIDIRDIIIVNSDGNVDGLKVEYAQGVCVENVIVRTSSRMGIYFANVGTSGLPGGVIKNVISEHNDMSGIGINNCNAVEILESIVSTNTENGILIQSSENTLIAHNKMVNNNPTNTSTYANVAVESSTNTSLVSNFAYHDPHATSAGDARNYTDGSGNVILANWVDEVTIAGPPTKSFVGINISMRP